MPRLLSVFAVLVPLLPACAAAPAAGPAVPESVMRAGRETCPPPLVWEAGATAPQRLQVRNVGLDTLDLFLDRCFHHTRLGAIPPGSTMSLRLPRRLVAYPEGLRLHAFHLASHRRVATFHVPVEPRRVLEAVVDPAADVDERSFTLYRLDEDAGPVDRQRVVEDGEGGGFVSFWGVGGGGILTWACGAGGDVHVSLTLGRESRGDRVLVRVAFDDRPWSDPRPWEVVRSLTDAVVAPQADVPALTSGALGAGRARVEVLEGRLPRSTTFAFQLDGAAEALGSLRCLDAGQGRAAGHGRLIPAPLAP